MTTTARIKARRAKLATVQAHRTINPKSNNQVPRCFQWVKRRDGPLMPRLKERGQKMWFRFANGDVDVTANGLSFAPNTGPWALAEIISTEAIGRFIDLPKQA